MSLCRIPAEIIRLIIENLDPDDLLQLASTSRHFKHIIHDKFISRKALEVGHHDMFLTSPIIVPSKQAGKHTDFIEEYSVFLGL
jgi:hypothetical protein